MQNGLSQKPMEDGVSNLLTTDLRTPLHEAASIGDYKLLEKLLNKRVDRSTKDSKHGNTPLHEAAWRGYSKCVKALCILPKTASAATSADTTAAKSLSKSKNSTKNTPIESSSAATLHSSLLGTRNTGGFSALHLAAQNGHNQSCREILLAGGDPDVQNNYGDTPLHTACRYGHAGATRILLSAKCDPLRVNLNGDTSLHIACAMGRRKLSRILLYAAGDVVHQIKNAQGETPRDIALRKNLPEILEILDAPIDEVRRERDRDHSSSSSRQNKKDDKKKSQDKEKKEHKKDRKPTEIKAKTAKPPEVVAAAPTDVNPNNWSPYGCHYFPDPRSFPSPKLETLPKEPLATGEQYFLDLAGNIRKGPVGVGNTCYCGPFFRHIEDRISRNKKSIKKYVHKATEKLDSKVQALALKTDDKIEQITRKMLADRIKCDGQRLHLEEWLKRGDRARATVDAHTSKSRKDQTNTNTLTRCRSLEMLDNNRQFTSDKLDKSIPARSYDNILLDSKDITVHHDGDDDDFSCTRSTRGHSDTDRRSSLLDFVEREWSGHSAHQSSDKNAHEDKSDSDLSRQIKKMEKLGGYSVAERLGELLSKTNEIIEMERSTRKKNRQAFSIINSTGSDKQTSKSRSTESGPRDRIRISSSRSKSSFEEELSKIKIASKRNDTSFIAKEMEKITSSLMSSNLSAVAGISPKSQLNDDPVSPELSKEYGISQKEKLQSRLKHEEQERSSILSGESSKSYQSRSKPNNGRGDEENVADEAEDDDKDYEDYDDDEEDILMKIRSGKFQEMFANNQYLNDYADDDEEDDDDDNFDGGNVSGGFSGFYQNTSFDDVITTTTATSSSTNTIKSERPQSSKNFYYQGTLHSNSGSFSASGGDAATVIDVDDHCELSEMANMKELNELKSRILNGSHWRSQVMRKNGFGVKYENNSETTPNRPDLNGYGKESTFRNDSNNDEHSESSEDEDEIDFSRAISSDQTIRFTSAQPVITQSVYANQLNMMRNSSYPVIVHPKPSIAEFPEYNRLPSQSVSANHNLIPQPSYSQIPNVIDTRCLIPKDAYFHELPNRNNRLIPISAAEKTDPIVQQTSRNRNPISAMNDVSLGQTTTNGHALPLIPPKTIIQPPYIHPPQQNYQLPKLLPHREKLLTNRKFGLSSDVNQFAPPQTFNSFTNGHLSVNPIATANFNGQALALNIDQVQLERDLNNDSGYSTKICGDSLRSSSLGPSPSLSGHTDPELQMLSSPAAQNSAPMLRTPPQPYHHHHNHRHNHHQNGNGGFYISSPSNIGASSLV